MCFHAWVLSCVFIYMRCPYPLNINIFFSQMYANERRSYQWFWVIHVWRLLTVPCQKKVCGFFFFLLQINHLKFWATILTLRLPALHWLRVWKAAYSKENLAMDWNAFEVNPFYYQRKVITVESELLMFSWSYLLWSRWGKKKIYIYILSDFVIFKREKKMYKICHIKFPNS